MQTLHQEYARFQVRFGAHLLGVVKIGSFNGTEFPNVRFIWGKTKRKERKDIIEQCKKRKMQVLIANQILDEGIDIPPITTLVNAVGFRAKSKLVQRWGRSLRTFPGKTHATIIDFLDANGSHLERHSHRRMKIVKEEGFDYQIVDRQGVFSDDDYMWK